MLAIYRNNIPAKRLQYTQTICPQNACNVPKQYARNMLAINQNNIPAKRLQYTQTICPQYTYNIPWYAQIKGFVYENKSKLRFIKYIYKVFKNIAQFVAQHRQSICNAAQNIKNL